ncbi:hypothetical protein RUM44_013835 [Polyplax serrata]|uniref:Cadherin domain-containing protein n=1 Tax=Polyplax serrata TaxID=468196 RepID=A0ABR1BFK2_POLSC
MKRIGFLVSTRAGRGRERQMPVESSFVTANDSDCGVNAKVNYTLGEEGVRLKEFQIKPETGDICIVAKLDYEKKKSYEFPVIASDRGEYQLEKKKLSHL